MRTEAALTRLAFAEARSSSTEALMGIARNRAELAQAVSQGQTEDTVATRFAEAARTEESNDAVTGRIVDKRS